MDRPEGTNPFAELASSDQEYTVYDSHYEKIGKVDDLLVDEEDRVAYLGVKMGLFGTNSTLIPVEILRVNDRRHLVEVSESAETIKHAPHFGQETVSPELEDRVRNYYGLDPLHSYDELHDPSGARGTDPLDRPEDRLGPDPGVDTEPGERAEIQDAAPTPGLREDLASDPASEPGGEPVGEPPPGQHAPRGSTDYRESETSAGGVRVHRRVR